MKICLLTALDCTERLRNVWELHCFDVWLYVFVDLVVLIIPELRIFQLLKSTGCFTCSAFFLNMHGSLCASSTEPATEKAIALFAFFPTLTLLIERSIEYLLELQIVSLCTSAGPLNLF